MNERHQLEFHTRKQKIKIRKKLHNFSFFKKTIVQKIVTLTRTKGEFTISLTSVIVFDGTETRWDEQMVYFSKKKYKKVYLTQITSLVWMREIHFQFTCLSKFLRITLEIMRKCCWNQKQNGGPFCAHENNKNKENTISALRLWLLLCSTCCDSSLRMYINPYEFYVSTRYFFLVDSFRKLACACAGYVITIFFSTYRLVCLFLLVAGSFWVFFLFFVGEF